jgi:hypothetical protein
MTLMRVSIRIRMPVVAAMVRMTTSRSPVVESTVQGYFYANLASLGCIVHFILSLAEVSV